MPSQGTASLPQPKQTLDPPPPFSISRLASHAPAGQTYISPFTVEAAKHGYYFQGGKVDDICVLVARLNA